MTIKELLALSDDELALELAKVLVPGPWKHKDSRYDPVLQHGFYCTKCHRDLSNGVIQTHCPVPDPIKLEKLGEALERFRGFSRNELFDGMLDIARPHQPNGEYSNMPVDQMLEIAERYCLYRATAKELWIISAVAQGKGE